MVGLVGTRGGRGATHPGHETPLLQRPVVAR